MKTPPVSPVPSASLSGDAPIKLDAVLQKPGEDSSLVGVASDGRNIRKFTTSAGEFQKDERAGASVDSVIAYRKVESSRSAPATLPNEKPASSSQIVSIMSDMSERLNMGLGVAEIEERLSDNHPFIENMIGFLSGQNVQEMLEPFTSSDFSQKRQLDIPDLIVSALNASNMRSALKSLKKAFPKDHSWMKSMEDFFNKGDFDNEYEKSRGGGRKFRFYKKKLAAEPLIDSLFQMNLQRWNNSEPKTDALGREVIKHCDDILCVLDRIVFSPPKKAVIIANINKLKRKVEHCAGHFDLAVGHYEKFLGTASPSDFDASVELFGLYSGMPENDIRDSMRSTPLPCLDLDKAYATMMQALPNQLNDDGWRAYLANLKEQNKRGMVLFFMKMWGVKALDEWGVSDVCGRFMSDREAYYMDLLCSFSVYKRIRGKDFQQAESELSLIRDKHSFLRYIYQARIAKAKGQISHATHLYKDALTKDIPVYQELADLLKKSGNTQLAADTMFAAERYYKENDCHQLSVYCGFRAEILEREARLQEKQWVDGSPQCRFVQQEAEAEEAEKAVNLAPPEPDADEDTHDENTNDILQSPVVAERHKPAVKRSTKELTRKPLGPVATFYNLQAEIDRYMSGSVTADQTCDLSEKIQQALKSYPDDLWLLHLAGWWYFGQGNLDKARSYLLKGLQLSCGSMVPLKLAQGQQAEKQLGTHILNNLVKPFEAGSAGCTVEACQAQSLDIAAFLSAYAHILKQRGLHDCASEFRNAADRLDPRRGAKAKAVLIEKLQNKKVDVVSPEKFELIKRAQARVH